MQSWPPKDPNDVLDYAIDWNDVLDLDADAIASAVWTFPSGVTMDSQAEATGVTTVWISGGTAGTRYEISCRLTTTGGRTYDRTVTLSVRQA